MKLRHIEIFRAVMLSGTISDAARLLHVSQPAVSQALRHMESRLKLRLFERIKGRLQPTDDARLLYNEVAIAYERIQRVQSLATSLRARREGVLRVVASPGVGHLLMPRALSDFRTSHADVEFQFETLSYDAILDRLLLDQADAGVVICPSDEPAFVTERIGTARLVCALPAGHPLSALKVVSPADLRPYPLVSFDSDNAMGRLVEEAFQRAGESRRIAIRVRFGATAHELVRNGLGVAVVDSLTVAGTSRDELVVREFEPGAVMQVAMLTPAFRPRAPLTEALVESLIAAAGALDDSDAAAAIDSPGRRDTGSQTILTAG